MAVHQHLCNDYKSTPEKVATLMAATITFTKPVEVLHAYKCNLERFTEMHHPNKGESQDEFHARMAATWFTLVMTEGEGDTIIKSPLPDEVWDLTIDYENENDQEVEDDDKPCYVVGDIMVSSKRAYKEYQETLPEEIARKKALRDARLRDEDEKKRLSQVATLKKMLSELGEKV
jgi:hypothetical protein